MAQFLDKTGVTYLWGKIKDTFALISHSHSADDISSTVPIAKGGTGATTASGARNNLGVAPASHVHSAYAPIASPVFTGTPSAPTPTVLDNSTKIATTEFVKSSSAPSGFGVGTTPKDISDQDVLTYAQSGQSGFYIGTGCTNSPNPGWYYYVIMSTGNMFAIVNAYARADVRLQYTGLINFGVWSGWTRILNVQNLDNVTWGDFTQY